MNCDRRYKLTAYDVLEMRTRYASSRVTFRQIAKTYGISMACARQAIIGETWSELSGAFPTRHPRKQKPRPKNKVPWSRMKEYIMAYRERFPERHAARLAANAATRKGVLVRQPCEVCGSLKVEAHHDDYTKPLEVRWFCRDHHTNHHKHNRPLTGVEDYSI